MATPPISKCKNLGHTSPTSYDCTNFTNIHCIIPYNSSPHPLYLALLEDPVYPQHVIQHFIEEHQRDVQLLLVEDLEASMHVVPQVLLVNRQIVLGQPVAVQDRMLQGSLKIAQHKLCNKCTSLIVN